MRTVSVIVPVRNESRSIARTLHTLLTQDYPRDGYEVIVADGGSTDDTVAIVRRMQAEYPNLKLVFNPGRWASAGRNQGLRQMTGTMAVIVDGHCYVPDAHYVRNVLESFHQSGAESLGRPQPLDVPDPTPFQAAVAVARASRLGHNPSSDIFSDTPKFVAPQSTGVAYTREVFETLGGFDERFDACEDVEFNQRVDDAGFRCYFDPRIKIVYDPRQSFRGLVTQLARYGAGRARLAAKHQHSLTLPALVPPVWLAWLLVGAVASVLLPFVGWAYMASLLLYIGGISAESVRLARRQPLAVAVRIPIVFVGIHVGFGWGFWREVYRQLANRPAAPVAQNPGLVATAKSSGESAVDGIDNRRLDTINAT
jgi:succinoglycan biosynthesis protein ExoA